MKYNYSQNKTDYKTPPELIEKALSIIYPAEVFSLDTCCSDTTFPAENYYIEGITDGLKADWMFFNWCNPPFNQCQKWIKKAYDEQQKGNFTVMLLPVRTETKYWHDYILFNPDVSVHGLRKGYKFIDADSGEYLGIFKNALALVVFKGK